MAALKFDGRKLFTYIRSSAKDNTERANEHQILDFFDQLFPHGDFRRQKDAKRSDGWVRGHLLLEVKSEESDWLSGLCQAIAYSRDLDYKVIIVVTKGFLAVWNLQDIPKNITRLILEHDGPPSKTGKDIARAIKERKDEVLSLCKWRLPQSFTSGALLTSSFDKQMLAEFINAISIDRPVYNRVTPNNFPEVITMMKEYFDPRTPTAPLRAFYSVLTEWTQLAKVTIDLKFRDRVIFGGQIISNLIPGKRDQFSKFVQNYAVQLAEGQSEHDFFSVYDRGLDAIDPEIRRRNGVFFTDPTLARLAVTVAHSVISRLGEEYIVVDPACGSGNLITSWKSPLQMRHKIISEIEPDLLFAVEKRMSKEKHDASLFTIIPRERDKNGLNFIDKSASEWLDIVNRELLEKNVQAEKPLAFFCNPPYRNSDGNKQQNFSGDYKVHPSIVETIGEDAAKETLCCFLAQMQLICKAASHSGLPSRSLMMVFTQTSWLLDRPIYKQLRQGLFSAFSFKAGFIVNSHHFFDGTAKWPLAFTIWEYVEKREKTPNQDIQLLDLCHLNRKEVDTILFSQQAGERPFSSDLFGAEAKLVNFSAKTIKIQEWASLKMNDFKRSRRKNEPRGFPTGGLLLSDARNTNKKAYGESSGENVGFMDDLALVRVKNNSFPNRPWFRLNSLFMDCRKTRCFSGPPDQKGYSTDDIETLDKLVCWYSLSKLFSVKGYPLWANAMPIWAIDTSLMPKARKDSLVSFTYGIMLATNECVYARIPADNPVRGCCTLAQENPLSPFSRDDLFWGLIREKIALSKNPILISLLTAVEECFQHWGTICNGSQEIDVHYSDKPYMADNPIIFLKSGLIELAHYAAEYEDHTMQEATKRCRDYLAVIYEDFRTFISDANGIDYFGKRPFSVTTSHRAK